MPALKLASKRQGELRESAEVQASHEQGTASPPVPLDRSIFLSKSTQDSLHQHMKLLRGSDGSCLEQGFGECLHIGTM